MRVLSVFGRGHIPTPVMWRGRTLLRQVLPYFLDQAFRLSIGPGVVSGGEDEGDPQSVTEGSPHPGDKLGPVVRDDILRNPKQT